VPVDNVVFVVVLVPGTVEAGGHVVLVVVVDGGRVVVGGGSQSGNCNGTAMPEPTAALKGSGPAA
jgi:hypothetical protein